MSAEATFSGATPELDRYSQSDVHDQATTVLTNMLVALGTGYVAEQLPAATAVWQEWDRQIVDPLKGAAAKDGVRLAVDLEKQGVASGTVVDLDFITNSQSREGVEEARRVERASWGLSRHAGALGRIYHPDDAVRQLASSIDASLIEIGRPVEEAFRLYTRTGSEHVRYIQPDELHELAVRNLRKEWASSQVVGVVYNVQRGRRDQAQLAAGIVSDPGVDRSDFEAQERAMQDQLNPYARISDVIGSSRKGEILEIDPARILNLSRTRIGRASLTDVLERAAHSEHARVAKMLQFTEYVLDAVVSSPDYQIKVDEASAETDLS